jgi:hypothetical protein
MPFHELIAPITRRIDQRTDRLMRFLTEQEAQELMLKESLVVVHIRPDGYIFFSTDLLYGWKDEKYRLNFNVLTYRLFEIPFTTFTGARITNVGDFINFYYPNHKLLETFDDLVDYLNDNPASYTTPNNLHLQ